MIMKDIMKLLQVVQPGNVMWRAAPMPRPGNGEVLLKVEAITTCPHWDLHILDGVPMFPGMELSYPYFPGQPGHEAAGEIVEIGPGVAGFAAGDRVAVWRDGGPKRQGCYAQYVCIKAENLLAIPTHLAVEEIASLELAMCVQVTFNQLAKLEGVQGKRLGISGLGPAGLIAVQMARSYGAHEIIGIDPLPERRALATRLGADGAFAPGAHDFPATRTALDTAIDTTGLKVSIEALMASTQKTVAMFGVLREKVEFGFSHWYGGFALLGYGKHNREAGEQALQLILNGQLKLAPLVTQHLPLSRYTDGVELLRKKQAIKICFHPDE
jgi:threonine dehydrogenase-like Zn-dependent dehydrogenase